MANRTAQRCFLAPALVLLSAVAPAAGQPVTRPDASRRIAHRFDFEDAGGYAVPLHWARVQDEAGARHPGFPLWNEAGVDYKVAFGGQVSVRLPTAGGSTSLRLDPGVVPVFPDTEYLVAARVRTQGLTHARAVLVARLLDRAGAAIAGSEARSAMVISENRWTGASAALAGAHPDAAYIQIELSLLQPELFAPAELGPHQVWKQDLSGAAWFDDVTVIQVPRVGLSTSAPCNVAVSPETPSVVVSLRDLAGETLRSVVTVQDLDGREVSRAERRLEGGRANWSISPQLPAFGWYRAVLEVYARPFDPEQDSAPERRIGAAYVDFVWLPPPDARAPRGARHRFGLVVDDLPDDRRDTFPELLSRAGAGWVSIPVWTPSLKPEQVPGLTQDLIPLVERLLSLPVGLRFSASHVPDELAAGLRADPDDVLSILALDETEWGPYLLPILDRFGQRVQRWQLGRAWPQSRPAMVREKLAKVESTMSRLVPGPALSIPWDAEAAPPSPAERPDAAELLIPYGAPPEAMALYAAAWADPALRATELTIVLEPLPVDRFSRRDAAAALVRRTIAAWEAFASDSPGRECSMALVQPWTGAGRTIPAADLAVWRTLADRLWGRRVVGRLPVAPGVTCFILAPAPDAPSDRAGALVAWRNDAEPGAAVLDAFLGEGSITAVDLFGNVSPVPQVPPAEGESVPTHRVSITDTPVFIEGVDTALARFISSFHVEPALLSSLKTSHEVEVVLENPWPSRIEGRMRIVEPGGLSGEPGRRDRSWRVEPREARFSIEPGDTARIPVTVGFSPAEEAGTKPFIADVDLIAERDYGRLRLRTALEVGLDAIQLDLSYRFGTEGPSPDVIVEAMIANRGTEPVTLQVTAFAPPGAGLPRVKASISKLAPGSTVIRRFPFARALDKLRGQRISVGVEDVESGGRISRSVGIE